MEDAGATSRRGRLLLSGSEQLQHQSSARASGAFISSSKCGGSQDGLSFLLDWKPVKRVDIYAGVMLSNVYGGLANGFFSTSTVAIPGTTKTVSFSTARTQNYDPTVGLRIRF